MAYAVDPRARMRDALVTLIRDNRAHWHQPTLAVFRNRLLDLTGSDARPLADLLLEAVQRGWDRDLPRAPLAPHEWDTLAMPFVMRWSGERFIHAEMAQWAAESWALALGAITDAQIRIARAEPNTPTAVTARVAGTMSANARGVGAPANARPHTAATAAAAARAWRAATANTQRSASALPVPPYRPRRPAPLPMLDARIVWGLAGAAALAYAGFIARIAWALRHDKMTLASSAATTPPAATNVGAATRVLPATDSTPTVPLRADNAAPTTTGGYGVVTSVAPAVIDSSARPAPTGKSPGVPSVTRSLLDTHIADPNRMLYVEPAKRASGGSVPVELPALPSSLTYDEVILDDGTDMRGRVEIVRAGTVIFRDMKTGLRHELRKDDIDRIITEYGAPVRFRPPGVAPGVKGAAAARARVESGVRTKGVAGSFAIRYAAATAIGSPECTQVWTRPPNALDRAIVRHVAGADTLSIAFDGGDTFSSNIDADGYFASTFRIVPDQARSSTALTTRLTGQFLPNGALSLQVSIVFFRRMRAGTDLTCTVTVNATGTRERG